MIPADGKISKDTTKIVGKAHRNASILLENTTKNLWIGPVTADENGVFTMAELDLSAWAGDTARFRYEESELDEMQFPEFTIQQ